MSSKVKEILENSLIDLEKSKSKLVKSIVSKIKKAKNKI